MQMQTALRRGVLVPHLKQQAEAFKTVAELIRADRGGLVYQPLVGLHRQVAEIDFISMYPGLMVHFNISPETVGVQGENTRLIPELGIPEPIDYIFPTFVFGNVELNEERLDAYEVGWVGSLTSSTCRPPSVSAT